MVISINYNKDGQNNAFIAYFTFICDNKNRPNSTKLIKQCIIVNGLPFEIKSIYGLNVSNTTSGAKPIEGMAQDESNKECTVCLSEDSNCIIMPCGHLCVCLACGKSLQRSEHA